MDSSLKGMSVGALSLVGAGATTYGLCFAGDNLGRLVHRIDNERLSSILNSKMATRVADVAFLTSAVVITAGISTALHGAFNGKSIKESLLDKGTSAAGFATTLSGLGVGVGVGMLVSKYSQSINHELKGMGWGTFAGAVASVVTATIAQHLLNKDS